LDVWILSISGQIVFIRHCFVSISLYISRTAAEVVLLPRTAMFASYQIDPTAAEVVMTYRVHPSCRQWVRLMNDILADGSFVPRMNFLFDKRAVGAVPDSAYAEAVARYYRFHRDRLGRCAILVDGLLAYGMARVVEGYCGDDRVRVFTEFHVAKEWLADHSLQPDVAA
jgi:hypothetical protein